MVAPKVADELSRASGVRLCGHNVRNRPSSANIGTWRLITAVPPTQCHRQSRIVWTNTRHRWIQRWWNEVLFTDGSYFNIDFIDGRHKNEQRDPEIIIPLWLRKCYGLGWNKPPGWTDLATITGALNSQRFCNQFVVPRCCCSIPTSRTCEDFLARSRPSTHPTTYTRHSMSYTKHSTSYTRHPTSYTRHPTSEQRRGLGLVSWIAMVGIFLTVDKKSTT